MSKLISLFKSLSNSVDRKKKLNKILDILKKGEEKFDALSLGGFFQFYFSAKDLSESEKQLLQQCASYIEWENVILGKKLQPLHLALNFLSDISNTKQLWDIVPKEDKHFLQTFLMQLIDGHSAFKKQQMIQQSIYSLIIFCITVGKLDPNQPFTTGLQLTPLMLVIQKNDEDLCGKFLKIKQINVNQFNGFNLFNPLHQSIYLKQKAIFELLLEKENIDLTAVTDLREEIPDDKVMVKQLPARNASMKKELKKLEQKSSSDVQSYGFYKQETALMVAARLGLVTYVESLLKKSPELLKKEASVLLYALRFNQWDAFTKLLSYCDESIINSPFKNGCTVLMHVVFMKRVKALERLLEKCDPQAYKTNGGVDAVLLALYFQEPEVIEVFRQYYAKKNPNSKMIEFSYQCTFDEESWSPKYTLVLKKENDSMPIVQSEKPLTGFSYLSQYFSKEEILELRKSAKEEKEEKTEKKPEARFTWFEGRFSTEHPHIKYIDPTGNKTPNQYFYDNAEYCDYGKNNVLRFARNDNQQGIKDYKSNDSYEITLFINGEKVCQREEKFPSGEDKLLSTKNRMLLFSFQSDDNQASLHIPVEEIDSHKNSSLKGITSFQITLFDTVENNKHSDDNNNNVYSKGNIS